MKITCQSCQAKYTIADEKVAGKTVKIKCKKCGATIVVNGAEAASAPPMEYQQPAAAHMAAAPPGDEDDGDGATRVFAEGSGQMPGGGSEWTVNVTDEDQRTMTAAQIVDEYRRGVVNGDTYVWKDGMADWLPLSGVPELMMMMGAGAPTPAAGAPMQSTMAMPQASPVAMPSPMSPMAAAPMAAAPMMAEPPGGLGGTMIMPEGAPAPMAAAPMAAAAPAAARRKGGGGGVDLFAPGAADAAPAAAAHTATTSADRLVGERNENSVLFSISALTAAAAAQNKGDDPFDLGPSPARNGGRSGGSVDDLMNLGGGGMSAPVLAPPPLLAPVVEAPPPPAPVMAAPAPMMMMPEAPPKKSNTGLIIGLVAGVAVLASVGTFFAVSSGGKTTTPDATNATGTSTAAAATAAADTAAPTAAATQAPAADTATAAPATAEPASTGSVAAANPSKGGPAPVGGPARHDDKKKDDKKKDDKKDDKKKDDKKKDEPAAGGTKEFDRAAALSSLSAAAGGARGCKKDDTPTGSGKVRVTFATSGRVTSATLESGPWAGTSAAGCIVGAFRGAHVPPFAGAPVSVSKTVSIR